MTREEYLYMINSFEFERNCTFLDVYEYRIFRIISTYFPKIFPSVETIASCAVVSTRTVIRTIDILIDKKLVIKKTGWKIIRNRKTRVNEYIINTEIVQNIYMMQKSKCLTVTKHSDCQTLNIVTDSHTKEQIERTNIKISKADALEDGGLETNLVSTSQIGNAEISSESSNDTDSKIQVAFNAEIELSRLSYLDDDEELLAYAKLAEDGPVGPLEEQNREIIAKQSDSSTADQAPAKALETSPTLQPHKPPLTIPETSKNTEIDEMKVVRMWNIITAPYRITILKVCEMPNQKRWQNIRAFSKHLNIDINLWANIFQYIVKDGFWNGKGNSKGQKISKLSFDMILNADKLNNFIDEINHLRELMIQREIEDVEFSNINAPLDLQKEIGL